MTKLIDDYACIDFIKGEPCYSCGKITCANKKCKYFCRECKISRNDEHIPPKSLFEQNKGYAGYSISNQDKRKVFSCYGCNNGASNDDEYFLSIITIHASNWNQIANFASHNRRLRGIIRDSKLRENLLKNMSANSPLYSTGGTYLGNIPYSTNFDSKKFDKTNIKIIKGYYYKKFKKILYKDPKFQWTNMPYEETGRLYTDALSPEIQNVIHILEAYNQDLSHLPIYNENVQSGVFSYGYSIQNDNLPMYWYLNYYNCCKFIYEVELNTQDVITTTRK